MSAAVDRLPGTRSIFAPEHRSTSGGILILITMIAFEAMAVAAALPTAAREVHGLGAIGWAFTGFLVANVVGMVVSGQVSDARGPRRPMVAGLVSFIAGLAVSGTASSMAQLVAGRCIQGLGAGLLITAIYVVLGATYPEHLRPKIFAAMSSAWVLPSLLGPIISGTLAQHASWRWVFLGLLPFVVIGALLMVPVLRGFPERDEPATSRLADPRRVLHAFAAALGVAALEAAGQHPSPVSIAAAALGAGALVWGLRALLPQGTVRVHRGVSAAVAMRGLLAGSLFGVESMVPLTLVGAARIRRGRRRPAAGGVRADVVDRFLVAGTRPGRRRAGSTGSPDPVGIRLRRCRCGAHRCGGPAGCAGLGDLPGVGTCGPRRRIDDVQPGRARCSATPTTTTEARTRLPCSLPTP